MLTKIKEGKAEAYIYNAEKISREMPVFYNPDMKLNRDISTALIKSTGKNKLIIADILAGSGIRSARFFKELPRKTIKELHTNDASKNAFKLIKKNFSLNKIKSKKIFITNREANKILLDIGKADYIDIDPFGSPNSFLDSAIKKISNGGILAVTATDTSALSGTHPEACRRKYWAEPLKNELMHEIGIRILIRKIQLTASQYDKALIPLLSYSALHYMRIFLKCEKSKQKTNEIIKQHKFLLYCEKCSSRKTSEFNKELCCREKMAFTGPLWTGQLWDKKITQKINLQNKIMNIIEKESKIDTVGFYDTHKLCSLMKIIPPKKEDIIKEIKKRKYSVAETHFTPTGLRSNISLNELKNIIQKLFSHQQSQQN